MKAPYAAWNVTAQHQDDHDQRAYPLPSVDEKQRQAEQLQVCQGIHRGRGPSRRG